jgi:hypothetical protein
VVKLFYFFLVGLRRAGELIAQKIALGILSFIFVKVVARSY